MTVRLDSHNASVDPQVSAAGGCGTVDLRTGEVCLLPTHHPGGCDFTRLASPRGTELEQYPVGDCLVAVLGSAGPDSQGWPQLQRRIRKAWGAFSGLVLDLSGVDVLSRHDEELLARLHRESARHGTRVMLVRAGPSAAVPVVRHRFADAEVYRSVADALAAAPERRSSLLTSTLALSRQPVAARDARVFMRSIAEEWTIERDVAERAVDISSELTANAVKYGRGRIIETVEMDVHRVTVVVWDGSPQAPRMLPYRPGVSQHGLGLRIVQQLAGCWGFRTAPHGKFVWATIPRSLTG